jgi:uncharacterized short protein YbdD (DUF466 family)
MAGATMQRSIGNASRLTRWRRVTKLARGFWRGIRDWCGDSAYERYLHATKKRHPQDSLLTEKDFYVEQLQRRYSRPSRCC